MNGEIIVTTKNLSELVKLCNEHPFAFDTETKSGKKPNPRIDALVGLSIAVADHKYYLPITEVDKVKDAIQQMVGSSQEKTAHNLKFDWAVLRKYGIEVKPPYYDTMIGEWILEPDSKRYGLKNLAKKYLDMDMITYKQLLKDVKAEDFTEVPLDIQAKYSCQDAWATQQLRKKQGNPGKIFDLEMQLLPVLMEMENNGILMDRYQLESYSKILADKQKDLMDEIYGLAGIEININSPQQLAELLFTKLQLPPGKMNKKSKVWSTNEEELKKLDGKHPIITLLLSYRKVTKELCTYAEGLPKAIEDDGRIHTSFNQTGTATGRLSSSKPNLQNITADEGKTIRKSFIAKDGYVLISADYSQVEFRLAVYLAKEERFIRMIDNGIDVHKKVAADLLKKPYEEITEQDKKIGKKVNFGVIYGIREYGLSKQLKTDTRTASNYLQKYFSYNRKLADFLIHEHLKVEAKGFTETLLGRVRPMKGVNGSVERIAVNTPIQGTASDIIKIAMIRLDRSFKQRNMKSRMLLQVHDELVCEVPIEEVEEAKELVKHAMLSPCFDMDLPRLEVDIEVGKNWGEME